MIKKGTSNLQKIQTYFIMEKVKGFKKIASIK